MRASKKKNGMSLLELLAAITIVSVLSVLLIPRISSQSTSGKTAACDLNQAEIELQVQLWFRANGAYPAANLADIGAQTSYFPAGLPFCPVDGAAYTIDTSTGQVVGHSH